MNFTIISIAGFIAFVLLSMVFAIIKMVRKKNERVVVKEVPIPTPVPTQVLPDPKPPVQTLVPKTKSQDKQLFDKFVSIYDDGSLKFESCTFRPGARLTCGFGIAAGYRYYVKGTNRLWESSMPIEKREMRWGYVRPHMGVDRAGASAYTMKSDGSVINDVVRVPFNFNRSLIVDYGDYGYGTLISLINEEFAFEFRIAHMDPRTDILPWSFNHLKKQGRWEQGWVLGSAGTYGYSSGAHTHTEVKSFDEECEVFDILLKELYGDKGVKEYSQPQIIKQYKEQEHFKNASTREILEDWESWKKKKKIIFSNSYKTTRVDPIDGKIRSWYSSYHLFNKL